MALPKTGEQVPGMGGLRSSISWLGTQECKEGNGVAEFVNQKPEQGNNPVTDNESGNEYGECDATCHGFNSKIVRRRTNPSQKAMRKGSMIKAIRESMAFHAFMSAGRGQGA